MTAFIAHFKPEHLYPVPDGTILRYRGHVYRKDSDDYEVYMDVIGAPIKDWDHKSNAIHSVGDVINIPMIF